MRQQQQSAYGQYQHRDTDGAFAGIVVQLQLEAAPGDVQTVLFCRVFPGDDLCLVDFLGLPDAQQFICGASKDLRKPGQHGDIGAGR